MSENIFSYFHVIHLMKSILVFVGKIVCKESKLSDNEITVVHYSCIYLKKVNYLQVSNKYIVSINKQRLTSVTTRLQLFTEVKIYGGCR